MRANNWHIPTIALIAIILITFIRLSPHAYSLSPEFEADRLVLLAQDQINNNRYSDARTTLAQVRSLNTRYPNKFYYLSALTLAQQEQYSSAIRALEDYIEQSGKNAEHYYAALEKITEYRSKLNQTSSSSRKNSSTIGSTTPDRGATITWSEPPKKVENYLENIQFLYQISDPEKALLTHINNLLDFYGYGDKTIRAASRITSPNRFSLAITPPANLVTTKQQIVDQREQFTSSRMSVYGVNPYVDFHCRARDNSCLIRHPVTNDDWLQIVNNDEAARELAKALAELIKLLQAS